MKTERWAPFIVVAMILSAPQYSHAEQSDETALTQIRGQHAISSLFGLPAVAARPVQTREWQFSIEHSNQFMGGLSEGESLLLDGETSEVTIRHRQRLGPCVQLEATVPFIQHSGGTFDEAIDAWHGFFGLPDADRNDVPFDELFYGYSDSSGRAFILNTDQSGIGDVQISLQRSLGCFATADSTGAESIVRVGVKLPTGAIEELRGSGEYDFFADIQSPVYSNGGKWRAGVAFGALYVGRADLVIPNQNSLVGYGSFGAQYVMTPRLRLLAQLDWHTAFYRSGLRELGNTAIALSAGIRYLGPADQTLEFTISEDAAFDTTPDIVAKLSWTYRPPGGL